MAAELGKRDVDLTDREAAGRVAPAVPTSVQEIRDSTIPLERVLRSAAGQS